MPTATKLSLQTTLPTNALTKLQTIERELLAVLLERDAVVRAALVALLARQHLVQLGAPGAAKTLLMTELAKRISTANGKGLRCFDYLMTKFTTPEELFGPISVAGLKRDEYQRITTGRLVEAELGFLDEIFKASSAILNTLLRVINERVYTNGSKTVTVPLLSLFAASNELPQGNELEALWDRFLLRVQVGYLSDGGFAQFLRQAAQRNRNGHAVTSLTLVEIYGLQTAAECLPVPEGICASLEQLRIDLTAKGIRLSDRRWGQTLGLLRAHALLEGRPTVEEDDLPILKHCLWQTPEQITDVAKLLARLGNPLHAKAVDLGDQAASVHQECMAAQRDGRNENDQMSAAIEANTKLKQLTMKLQELHAQAAAQGKPTARIEKVAADLTRMKQEIASLVL